MFKWFRTIFSLGAPVTGIFWDEVFIVGSMVKRKILMFGRYQTENWSATSSFSDPLLMLSAIHCSTSGDDSRKICGSLF